MAEKEDLPVTAVLAQQNSVAEYQLRIQEQQANSRHAKTIDIMKRILSELQKGPNAILSNARNP
jgi:hypothetical protein